ncbi:MAG: hypothetical protein AAF310_04730 [Myxococcota bacterium]
MGAFMTLMRYYMSVSGDTKIEQVQTQIAQVLGAKSQEGVMTLAESLRKEGERLGLLKGKAEGKAMGKLERYGHC